MTRKLGLIATALSLVGALTFTLAVAQPAAERSDTMRLLRNMIPGPINQITDAMQVAGVRQCANRIDQTTTFLTQGTGSALLFLPERDPDNSLVSVSMELQPAGLPRAYASATFSPNTAVGCAVAYESVQYWAESCTAVAAKRFAGGTFGGSIGSEVAMLTIGPTARVFLLRSTPTSCVSIKKEVVR